MEKVKDNEFKLIFRDNGKGYCDSSNNDSLGMSLVEGLCLQLNGSLSFSQKNGVKYEIIIKDVKNKKHNLY